MDCWSAWKFTNHYKKREFYAMNVNSFNFLFISNIKRILRKLIEFKASLSSKSFYCKALSGMSTYNICINSDLTVSCNCRDYDGTGHIGDFSSQSFSDVLSGIIAKEFRKKLAYGRLPILTCTTCNELHLIDKNNAQHFEQHYALPEGIMLENTICCNLNCTQCARKEVTSIRKKKSLTLEEIKKVSMEIKRCNIKSLCFFSLGEPFLSPNIYDELKILRDDNPDLTITVSTNGTLLDNDKARVAALMLDTIIFSIDGISNKTLQKYQKKGSFEKSYNNMKALVDYRNAKNLYKPLIEWKYVLFNWNDEKQMILEAIKLASQAKVDIISFWPTRTPIYGISWRYYFSSFFKTIGYKNWKGREVNLRG